MCLLGKSLWRDDADFFNEAIIVLVVLKTTIRLLHPANAFVFDGLKQRAQAPAFNRNEESADFQINAAALRVMVEPQQIRLVEAGLQAVADLQFQNVFLQSFANQNGEELVSVRFQLGGLFSRLPLFQNFVDFVSHGASLFHDDRRRCCLLRLGCNF